MPNYALSIDSTFKPFTYQELVAPIEAMSEAHDKLAEQYDKLSSQADVLEALGSNDRDKGAYNRYKDYSDRLRSAADDLYRYGLNSESRMRLSGLRMAYNTDIVPIQNAWNKREEEAKMQEKLKGANPSIRFTRDAATTPIDAYINNPMGGYDVINLDSITSDATAAFKHLSEEIKNGVRVEGIDPVTNAYIRDHAFDSNIINAWLNGSLKVPVFDDIMNQVFIKHNVTKESLQNNPNASSLIGEISNAAKLGVWAAIGKDTYELRDNYLGKRAIDAYYSNKGGSTSSSGGTSEGLSDFTNPISPTDQELPLILADEDIKEEAEKYGTSLGFAKKGGSGKYATYILDNEGRLYDKRTQRLLTKKQFVNQAGDDTKKRKEYGEWYDNNIPDALEHLGYKIGDTPTARELEAAYKKAYQKGNAGYIRGLDVKLNNNTDWSKMGSSNAYPIERYTSDGKRISKDKAIAFNAVLNDVKDNKGTINNVFYVDTGNDPGFIFEYMSKDNKVTNYFVPLNMGNSRHKIAKALFDEAKKESGEVRENKISEGIVTLLATYSTYDSPAMKVRGEQPTSTELKKQLK